MVTELNSNESVSVSGGLINEIVVTGIAISSYNTFKNLQNGSCRSWKEIGWSSELTCLATNGIEDGIFYGGVCTLISAYFRQKSKKAKIKTN